MTDEEKLLVAMLGEEDDGSGLFTMLEIVALLTQLGIEYRAKRNRALVAV